MKSNLIALCISLLLFSSENIYSQFGWNQQSSGTTKNLNSVAVNVREYTKILWAAGDSGVILKSRNEGTNWSIQSSGTIQNLNSVFFIDSLRGFAVGDNGTILQTINGGTNWNPRTSPVSRNLNSVACDTSGTAVAVGDSGTILRSQNGGLIWVTVPSFITDNINSVSFDYYSYVFHAAGNNGKILRSMDGINWVTLTSGTSANLSSIRSAGNFMPVLIAAGNNNTIIRSIDGGYSWMSITPPLSSDYTSLCTYSSFDGSVWTCGSNGTMMKSYNSGLNWIIGNSGTSVKLNCILFTSSSVGWAVGNGGTILHLAATTWGLSWSFLDANTINTLFLNDGRMNNNPTANLNIGGFEYPKGSGKFSRFTSGLWILAKSGSDTLLSAAEYSSEYMPGYTDNSGNPQGINDPAYRVYRLNYGVNDSNRLLWPNSLLGNSSQGAPVFFDTQSNTWKPLDYGDQTMFYSYTDSYDYTRTSNLGPTNPLKADIKQLNFAFDEPGAMGNVIYTQYTIINRSNSAWQNAYIAVWTDDDIGDGTDDKVGCDTVLQMGYTYNSGNYDPLYGSAPPAVSFTIIKGPIVYTANNNDTAFICNGKTKSVKAGYRQLDMQIFNFYLNGQDPFSLQETYNTMRGRDIYGNPRVNPSTWQISTLAFSGDPVGNTGWVQQDPGDQRSLVGFGPLTVNPGDTQIIVVAQVAARGTSNLNSITRLREYSSAARENYGNCFLNVPIGVREISSVIREFRLEQNYPNPFNPLTTIKFTIPKACSAELIIYDILGREVELLLKGEIKAGNYGIQWNGNNYPSGVYFYKLRAGDYEASKKMVLVK
jgi:photosystem II stability/assembly factor-like uncharacterized protein